MARRKDFQLQSTLSFFLIFLALSLVTIFADNNGFFSKLHTLAQTTTRPLREVLFGSKMALFLPFEFITEYKRVNQRVVILEKKFADSSAKLSELGSLKEENERMKSLLGMNYPPSWKFESGRVIGTNNDEIAVISPKFKPEVSSPLILADTESSARRGKGVFVGKVDKVIADEITGILPTSILSKIGVIVRNKDSGEKKGAGILMGKGGSALLDQLLPGEEISEGDLVVTSGEGKLPADLLIGYIGRVFQNKSSPWKQAEINFPLKPESLDYIFLISKQ